MCLCVCVWYKELPSSPFPHSPNLRLSLGFRMGDPGLSPALTFSFKVEEEVSDFFLDFRVVSRKQRAPGSSGNLEND